MKNILDQALYESEQREKNNRIAQQIDANKPASSGPMSLQGWIIIGIILLIAGGIATVYNIIAPIIS